MKKITIILSACVLFLACNNQPKQEGPEVKSPIDSLMEEVMHGHDAGMGKIGRVEKDAQEISHNIDSLQKINKTATIEGLRKAKNDLDVADSSMTKWMDTFDMEMQGMDSITKIKYLTQQEKWVKGIADSLKIALNNADSLLKKK